MKTALKEELTKLPGSSKDNFLNNTFSS